MRDDFRSSGRDRDHRNERGSRPNRRSGSRSPVRSKVSVVASARRTDDRDRPKSDRDFKDNRGRLRMDEKSKSFYDERDRNKETRGDRNTSLKRSSNSVFADLDRAVKKAREERNSGGYWNKKVLEVEEKDPNRWGHSGFKELYGQSSTKKNFRKSRSRSNSRGRERLRPLGRPLSRSQSRSPMLKQLHKARERSEVATKIKPLLPKGFLASKPSSTQKKATSTGKIRSLLSLPQVSPPKRLNTFRSKVSPVDRDRKRLPDQYSSRTSGVGRKNIKNVADKLGRRSDSPLYRNNDRKMRLSNRQSISFSPSDSDSSRTPSPQLRRPYVKPNLKGRISTRSTSKSKSRSRSRHGSRSRRSESASSSISSEDEDVLELHPRTRRSRSNSISISISSSSGSETSGSLRRPIRKARTSSSSSSSGSDSDHSMAMAKDKDRSRNRLPSPVLNNKSGAESCNTAKGQSSRKPGTTAKVKQASTITQCESATNKKQLSSSKNADISNNPPKALQNRKIANSAAIQKQVVEINQPNPSDKESSQVNKSTTKPVKQTAASISEPAGKKAPAATSSTKVAKKSVAKKAQLGSSTSTCAANSNSEQNKKGDRNREPSDIDSDSSTGIGEQNGKEGQAKAKTANNVVQNKPSKSRTSKSKEGGSGSVESDSASESSSDSESEPRMTLSERFAKLTQMNTDKREFAKPVLSPNEIDTKLKVVKNLRGPETDTKVYVESQTPKASWDSKTRPKSPEFSEGVTRYPSAERKRHFERMSRDTPTERPADWSNIAVRYNYYRDRGCFDERPLSLEEYSKWETWYYEYKQWLENEEFLNQQAMQGELRNSPIVDQEFSIGSRLGWRAGDRSNRIIRTGMASRLEQRIVRSPPESHPYFNERGVGNFHVNDRFARRIGHAPSGSLVVNIRQEHNFGRPVMQRGRRR